MSATAVVMGMMGDDPRRDQLVAEHHERCEHVEVCRSYYGGHQYDAENEEAAESYGRGKKLPEHLKKTAYSTQIQEAIDYIAAQLGEGFQVTADDADVQAIVTGALSNSPDLASDDDEDEINVVEIIRDSLVAGDVAIRVRWDEASQLPWFEFWESEAVDFHYADDNRFHMERVILSDVVWQASTEGMVEVDRRREWSIDPATGWCVIETFIDGELDGAPQVTPYRFIPWRLLRGQKRRLRAARGESLVTKRVRDLADRYDAIEQLAFVIARYNSHGNLAVIGDSALLKTTEDNRIHKDVADVLTFPGGTALQAITLPTDASMIEHQRQVILDAMFSAFGLTRIDTTTVQGMGNLSGYALEILNRKTDGTFSQVMKQLTRDIRSTLNLAIDVHEANTTTAVDSAAPADTVPVADQTSFTNRKMSIIMGTGYIVDEVMDRDDFTAGLVSRRYVLHKRGLSDAEIDDIEAQISKEKPAQPEVNLSPTAGAMSSGLIQAGRTLSAATSG